MVDGGEAPWLMVGAVRQPSTIRRRRHTPEAPYAGGAIRRRRHTPEAPYAGGTITAGFALPSWPSQAPVKARRDVGAFGRPPSGSQDADGNPQSGRAKL